ncbi:MAG: hypothetical protein V1743_00225 [Nanoarchaeota archaeon]
MHEGLEQTILEQTSNESYRKIDACYQKSIEGHRRHGNVLKHCAAVLSALAFFSFTGCAAKYSRDPCSADQLTGGYSAQSEQADALQSVHQDILRQIFGSEEPLPELQSGELFLYCNMEQSETGRFQSKIHLCSLEYEPLVDADGNLLLEPSQDYRIKVITYDSYDSRCAVIPDHLAHKYAHARFPGNYEIRRFLSNELDERSYDSFFTRYVAQAQMNRVSTRKTMGLDLHLLDNGAERILWVYTRDYSAISPDKYLTGCIAVDENDFRNFRLYVDIGTKFIIRSEAPIFSRSAEER